MHALAGFQAAFNWRHGCATAEPVQIGSSRVEVEKALTT